MSGALAVLYGVEIVALALVAAYLAKTLHDLAETQRQLAERVAEVTRDRADDSTRQQQLDDDI